MQGVYGERMQRNCRNIGYELDTFFNMIVRAFPVSYKLASVVVNYLLRDQLTRCVVLDTALQNLDRQRILGDAIEPASGAVGRFLGGLFTTYASTGGRFGRFARTEPRRWGYIGSNFVLASFGALIRLAIESRRTGGVTVADIAIVLLTGRAAVSFSNDEWIAIYRAVQQCSIEIDVEDQESFRQFFNTLNRFFEDVRRSEQ